jgi:inositol phosphorylceramide mannosyltransferase catalytic subunit
MRIVENRIFSQNGEDGVINSIFSEIGVKNKFFVEIGCEDGTECNTRYLSEQEGWQGIRIDAAHESESKFIFQHFVQAETVCEILRLRGAPEDFDLLSVDIDYNNFHVLKEILSHFKPRVVVVEYNSSLGPTKSLVVPYDPRGVWDRTNYFGASLLAFQELAVAFGYSIVFCDSSGVNAFMISIDEIPINGKKEIEQIYVPPRYGIEGKGHPADPHDRPYLRAEHYLLPGVKTANTRFGRINYFGNDAHIGQFFSSGKYWEEAEIINISNNLRGKRGLALDIGAHIGSHAVAMATLNPQLNFLCFEPQWPLFLLLERNIIENKLSLRMHARNFAVGHRDTYCSLATTVVDEDAGGERPVVYGGAELSNLGGVQIGTGQAETKMVRIDDLNLGEVVYAKFDVEGAEPLAFHGALETIYKNCPLIFFENRVDRRLPDEVLDLLDVPQEIRGFSPTCLLEALSYDIHQVGQDFLAVPTNSRNLAVVARAAPGQRAPQSNSDIKIINVPAIHPHWKGFLQFSIGKNEITHRESGNIGVYTLKNGALSVSWAQYPREIFVNINETYVELSLISKYIRRNTKDKIPKLIFQTWKSKTIIPENFEAWSESFGRFNPEYSRVLWDDDDNRSMIAQKFPWFLDVYDSYPREIYRADAVRYFFLYLYGGVYADMDVECLRCLDDLLEKGDVVLGRMGSNIDHPHSIPNAIMLSKPREEFWLLVIWLMINVKDRTQSPEYVTGPVILKSAVDIYQSKDSFFVQMALSSIIEKLPDDLRPIDRRSSVVVLPASNLFPVDWTDPLHQMFRIRVLNGELIGDGDKQHLFPHAWMTTYWSHSW